MAIGMFPTGYDGCNVVSGVEKRLSRERFSTMYKDRTDFENDRTLILQCVSSDIEVLQDILDKVSHTVKELDLRLGE